MPRRNMIGGPAVGISARCQHPDAAWKVVKFFVSPKFQKLPIQGLPARESVIQSPDFQGFPYWQVFNRELEFGDSRFFIEQYNDVNTIVSQYGERILTDRGSWDRIPWIFDEMNAKVNEMLRK